jgi:hypothetical protein
MNISELEPLVDRGKACLVGKLLADRIVPKDYFRAPLLRIWRLVGSVSFQVIDGNKFIAEFEEEGDKKRILEGRPWIFDGKLVVLEQFDGLTPPVAMQIEHASFWVRMYNLPLPCMSKETGKKIGSSVGVVEDVDILDDEPGWGEYLKLKIRVDLKKPLARGRMLHVPGRSLWIAFKYKKLPNFCYQCGVILHGIIGCRREGSHRNLVQEAEPYGPWLRVMFPVRRGVRGEARPGRYRGEGNVGDHQQARPVMTSRSIAVENSQEVGPETAARRIARAQTLAVRRRNRKRIMS